MKLWITSSSVGPEKDVVIKWNTPPIWSGFNWAFPVKDFLIVRATDLESFLGISPPNLNEMLEVDVSCEVMDRVVKEDGKG